MHQMVDHYTCDRTHYTLKDSEQTNTNRNEKTIGMKKLVQIGMIKRQIGMKKPIGMKPIGMKNGYK